MAVVDLRRWGVFLNWVLERECFRGRTRREEAKNGRCRKRMVVKMKKTEEAIETGEFVAL